MGQIIDFILHIDVYLSDIIAQYGAWTLAILASIIFVETGVVVMPFLPGDSLIFAAGTFAARGALNPWAVFIVLSLAAIAGDTVNYWIGHRVGSKAYSGEVRWIKKDHMERTTPSSRSMAARPFSWRVSCQSYAPSLRLWPESVECPTGSSSAGM